MSRFTTVRYGHMRQRGLFSVDNDDDLEAGDVCVVRTSRGHELGTVLARPIGEDDRDQAGCRTGACGSCATSQGKVVRRATEQDRESYQDQERLGTRAELTYSRRKARELGLPMRMTHAEYLLEREKLIFHFTCSERVDFRDLVRDLAHEFKTRIEMVQVGARDEARLVGDMASCGRELCCRTFLHDLRPVSMRMAKQQKKTLDPTKISGQCGKLKCCLRYEDEVYVELQKSLPRRNSWVRFEKGVARVLSTDLLLQKVVVEWRGERELLHVTEVLETGVSPPRVEEGASAEAPGERRARVTPVVLPSTSGAPASSGAPRGDQGSPGPASDRPGDPAPERPEPRSGGRGSDRGRPGDDPGRSSPRGSDAPEAPGDAPKRGEERPSGRSSSRRHRRRRRDRE